MIYKLGIPVTITTYEPIIKEPCIIIGRERMT